MHLNIILCKVYQRTSGTNFIRYDPFQNIGKPNQTYLGDRTPKDINMIAKLD
jgi:hypothetical protein